MRIRTGYSFHHSFGHVKEAGARIKEIGWSVLPISDRDSTFGFTTATKVAKELGLRPIYGVELGVTNQLEKDGRVDYWTFFATKSLRPLHDLVFSATENRSTGKRKQSLLIKSNIDRAPGIIKIVGEYADLDGVDPTDPELFFALSPGTSIGSWRRAKKLGFRPIATSDNFYPRQEDRETFRVTLGWRADTRLYPQHILSTDEWILSTQHLGGDIQREALDNCDEAVEACQAKMKTATLFSPPKDKSLREMCVDGAKTLGVDLSDPVYAERLDRELMLIDEKEFADYFHILADIINWAKGRMIVGPARGSSCGSLVCYLIGITTIDPVQYDLLFERFIDRTRSDLPDIDVDFSDVHRPEVFEYAEQKFGKEFVARLGSVNSFQPRSALNQIGIGLKIPSWDIARVAEGAVKRSGGDSRAAFTIEDTFQATDAGKKMLKEFPSVIMAARLEDHPTSAGRHAAGIIVTGEPVAEYVAVAGDSRTTMCDKKDAEALNLLKIDALGLTQLSIFERTLELMGVGQVKVQDGGKKVSRTASGWFEKNVPLDDQKAFDVVNNGNFSGIFQFTGSTVQSLANEMKMDRFDDVVALTALARPGPIGSGSADNWLRRRTGAHSVEYPHPLFEPALRKTFGVFVYQEQVMKVCRDVGDLSWDEVNALRRAMSKSLGQEFFDQYGVKFKAAAIAKGIPEMTVYRVWDELCQYGAMAFNESHSVAYGLVSYWSMWLKANYPLEFAAATLEFEDDPEKQIPFLRELKREGINYVAVDPDKSTDRWIVDKERSRLIGPLTNIDGFGVKTVAEVLDARKKKLVLRPSVAKKLESAKTSIDSLYPIADRVSELWPNLEDIVSSRVYSISDVQLNTKGHTIVMIGVAKKINQTDENTPLKIAKRGGKKYDGPHICLNIFLQDDTDEILARVFRFDYERIGKEIFERGRAGKAIYAIKGFIPDWANFRMIQIERVKYLGDMDEDRRRVEGAVPTEASGVSLAVS